MKKVTIIAEAGVNHNGSLINAFKLIDEEKKMDQILLNFRPSKELSPMKWNTLIGKKSKKKYKVNDSIQK
jgi:sialic acid synthase SpsE